MPGVWSPLIVICKTNTRSLKIWVALSNPLEYKPRIFRAVSCLIENMNGFVQLFLNPNQEYFKWFHVLLKYEWLCQTFLESKPGVFHVVSCLIEIPDTRNAIFESVEHACLASEVWSVPPENILLNLFWTIFLKTCLKIFLSDLIPTIALATLVTDSLTHWLRGI